MASVTITPSSGNAPFPTQGGVGASPGFDAIDFRRFWSRGLRAGVLTETAYRVTEDAGGASMTVDVAAADGAALVEGSSVADQGLYDVPPHSGVASLTLDAADPTNPRVDRVIIRVYDNEHDASGSTTGTIETLIGTPTAGATLDNRAGVATLPASCLLLAECLVSAAASTVPNANIRDYRAHGGPAKNDAGDLKLSAASDPGPGWLVCDGSTVNRAVYAELFAAIGTTYGAGDGSTTFALPDYRGRTPIGAGSGPGLTTRSLGQSGGDETHVLSTGELPAHTHGNTGGLDVWRNPGGGTTVTLPERIQTLGSGSSSSTATIVGGTTQSAGSGSAHANMQPWAAAQIAVYAGSVA